MNLEQDHRQAGPRAASGGLPLSFYIRSARLCLKKATLARLQPNSERGGADEELQHLRRFEALVACALPAHKEYCERRGDKAVRELHVGLVEARRRIQELLESGEAASSPKKSSPTKKSGSSSPRKPGSPKKTGSPKKSSSSPSKHTSPSKKSSPRSGSRPKAAIEKKTRPIKSPRTPVSKPLQPPKKIRVTPKLSESPSRKKPGSPRKKAESRGIESPRSKRQQKHQQDSDDKSADIYKSKKQLKSAEMKDWEAKLHDVYTFADEKPSVYYLPKRPPTTLHRHRRTAGSTDSRSTAPSARFRHTGVRDSTRSLPTGKTDKMFRDLIDQRKDRTDLFDLRKSYDDLGMRRDRFKYYDDGEEYYRGKTEESDTMLQRSRKIGLKGSLLERVGKTKLDKVWDNLVYEKHHKLEGLSSPASPTLGKSSTKILDSYSCDGADTSENRSICFDENKNGGVKVLVRDLKGSLDGFRIRLEEEGKRWRGRINALEKEIEFLRDETEGDLVVIRRNVQEEARKRENFAQKMVMSVDTLEEGFAKDIDNLRVEVSKKGDKHWMENVIRETVEKCLSNRPEAKEKPLKDEVRLLKAELELLSRGRVELESHVEQLVQIVENDRESMSTEQINARTENGYIRKQIQGMKKEGLQARVEAEEFRKGYESDMEELKRVLGKLKDETMQMKCDLQGLRALEETVKADRGSLRRSADRIRDETSQEKMLIMDRVENLSKLYLGGLDEVRMDVLNVKVKCQDKLEEFEEQLRDIKQKQESLPCSRSSSRGAPSLEELESRIAHLESKQELMHMAGLEEARMAIFNVDMKCQDKVDALEQQLKEVRRRSGESPAVSRSTSRDFLFDDLESRLSVVERKQDSNRYMLEDAITVAEKEKRLAAVAASDAAAAASKAEDALAEVLRTVDPDNQSSRYNRRNRLQESLTDTFSAAASEIKKNSIDVTRETESAVAAASVAKQKAEELQQQLKDALSEVDRQKNMAAEFAAKANSISTEAKDLLAEMAGMRRTLLENGSTDMDSVDRSETSKLLTELEKRMEVLEQSSRTKNAAPEKPKPVAIKGKLSTTTKKRLESEELKLDTRVSNLESHLEHVATATYSNIRMLDQKVENVSVSAQSALEGVAIAEKKCGALGAELVKVFRVLASFRKDSAEKQKESSSSVKSTSPARRPHFACDSCKKVASTILNGSLEFLPSDVKSKDVKKVNLRLATSNTSDTRMATREQQQELHSPVAEREETECAVHGKKIMSTQERIAKVEESIQSYGGSTRRSWGTGVASLLLSEEEKSKQTSEEKSRPTLEDIHTWGIKPRGINVLDVLES